VLAVVWVSKLIQEFVYKATALKILQEQFPVSEKFVLFTVTGS